MLLKYLPCCKHLTKKHFTAVTVAIKDKMDLAIGVAVGSSMQIALLVTPLMVLLGWIIGADMTLFFNTFETAILFITVLYFPSSPLPLLFSGVKKLTEKIAL